MEKKVTIADIAKLANVHKSTVSRVLNQSAKVNSETRQKIERIIHEQGYRPNPAARALATGRIRSIAVIVAERSISKELANPSFPHLLYGISHTAALHHYHVTIITSSLEQANHDYLDMIKNHFADGFIVIGASKEDTFSSLFQREKIPFVIIGRPDEPSMTSWIATDNQLGGYMAATHLLELGHRQILIIGGYDKWHHNLNRILGVKKALREWGQEPETLHIILNKNTTQKAYDEFTQIVEKKKRALPDAVFCLSDSAALGVATAASDLGLDIPKDLSLIGFGNYAFSEYMRPKLTTIREEFDRMGEMAVHLLLEQLHRKGRNTCIELEPILLVRESTASAKKRCGGG